MLFPLYLCSAGGVQTGDYDIYIYIYTVHRILVSYRYRVVIIRKLRITRENNMPQDCVSVVDFLQTIRSTTCMYIPINSALASWK